MLGKELKGQLECFRENTGKYITFSVATKKELDNSRKLRTKLSLLIVLDLCQLHYQKMFIIYLKFT